MVVQEMRTARWGTDPLWGYDLHLPDPPLPVYI